MERQWRGSGAVKAKADLVEMGRDRNIRRVTEHLVLHYLLEHRSIVHTVLRAETHAVNAQRQYE